MRNNKLKRLLREIRFRVGLGDWPLRRIWYCKVLGRKYWACIICGTQYNPLTQKHGKACDDWVASFKKKGDK